MKALLIAMLERAIKTAAQTALALLGTNTVGITDVDWTALGSASLLAAFVSLLTSVASAELLPGAGPAAFGPEEIGGPGPV